VLTGSGGTPGGTSPNGWAKHIAHGFDVPEGHDAWNELLWPIEYPLSTNEMSFLLPHFLREGRGKLDVYFSRVYNPVWTNPDGFAWIEALTSDAVGLHVALTPTWSETAAFADYVLPMGHSTERHDTHSYETHAGRWLGFRQPVRRVAMERLGQPVNDTRDANPGEVWEENEFWFELSWRIDPDGQLGIRRYFESPYRPGEKVTVDEYYRWVFENRVPGLPEKAAEQGMTPLAYMRKYGAVEIARDVYRQDERRLTDDETRAAIVGVDGVLRTPTTDESTPPLVGEAGSVGVRLDDGSMVAGWLTPSRKLELYSESMAAFGWPEYATPMYIESHVAHRKIDTDAGEMVLVPTFRLPTLVHTRSANAKYLNELGNTHPLWVNADDATRLHIATGDLVRVTTRIGYFVARAWAHQGIRPGVIALSHHMGRWRLTDENSSRWTSGLADLTHNADGVWRLRYKQGVRPFASSDPDSSRISWEDPGVHQNLAFPVQPDPLSGAHCWLQHVHLSPAVEGDRYGDVEVDSLKAREAYHEWLALTRPGPSADGLRRPEFMMRPVKPKRKAFRMPRGDAVSRDTP
jgi:anaerobic selenocysteine-containing dehydrogenase